WQKDKGALTGKGNPLRGNKGNLSKGKGLTQKGKGLNGFLSTQTSSFSVYFNALNSQKNSWQK
ncbi:hypothetical protein AC573_13355, partial [Mannheimia haemolytica]|uniref:hypothetical protein n=1 Tax=Mannheimia haemolytica TaxID=75985 RepID=UPI000797785C